MYSFPNRINTIATYGVSVLSFVVIALALTSIFLTPGEDVATVEVKAKLHKFGNLRISGDDRAIFIFDIQADLRPIFHWNVKQLFVYLYAEYKTKKNEINQVVVWDYIIESKDEANLNFTNIPNKYPLTDQGRGLRGNEITFKLSWNVIPNAGLLFSQTSSKTHVFKMPEDYNV